MARRAGRTISSKSTTSNGRAATKKRPATRPGGRSRAARKRPIVADDLERLVFVGSPRVSPDGARIAFTHKTVGEKNAYRTDLWMVSADGSDEPRRFTRHGRVAMPAWSPDGSAIAFVTSEQKHRPQVSLIPTGGGEARVLTDLPDGAIRALRWSPTGRHLAIAWRRAGEDRTKARADERSEAGLSDPPMVTEDLWYRLDGDGVFGGDRWTLHVIEVETGQATEVWSKDTLGHFDFDFAPDGERLVVSTNRAKKALLEPQKAELVIVPVGGGRATRIPDLPKGPKSVVRWSPDGSLIAYAGREGGVDGDYSTENLELWVCDPETGDARSLTGDTDLCLLSVSICDAAEASFEANFTWLPDGGGLLARIGIEGTVQIVTVPLKGRVEPITSGAHDHDLGTISDDGRTVALTRSSPDRPGEVFVGRRTPAGLETTAVTDLNGAWLDEVAVARPTSKRVRTADGTNCHVWTMLPPDLKRGGRAKRPGVLEIHGGPHGQYGSGFFHEFQVLAGAGHVVVYSNPRGSKGYGRDHCAAIRGRWGTADWVDMQAVIEHLRSHPNVDPKRMAVMGGSYGGYMTNWIIGHTDEFTCAITDRCVSNLVSMLGNTDWVEAPGSYFPGNSWSEPEPLWEQSPIRLFGDVRTPTLVIHSEGDLRCNVEQAEQVFVALKLNGVPARLVRYPRSTSHGMSRSGPPDMRLHRLGEISRWLSTHLG